MAALDDFLTGEFADLDRERKHVDDVIERTVKALENLFYRDKGWPYEISLARERDDYEWPDHPSTSTIAMISAALAAAAGCGQISVLSQHVEWQPEKARRLPSQEKRILEIVQEGWKLIVTQADVAIANKDSWTFRSGTFGTDDVFTLCWLVDLYESLTSSSDSAKEKKLNDGSKENLEKAESSAQLGKILGAVLERRGELKDKRPNSLLEGTLFRVVRKNETKEVVIRRRYSTPRLWIFPGGVSMTIAVSGVR